MPYQSSNRLSDLILRKGDIDADRAQRSGDMWAGLVRGLASIPAGIQHDRAAQAELAEKQQDRHMQRANVASQIDSRTAETADRIRKTQSEEEARKAAIWTKNTVGILGEYVNLPPEQQAAAWPQVQQRLQAEGGWEPEQIPKMPMPAPWVKGQLAKFLPIDKAYSVLFPEPTKGVVVNPGGVMKNPETGAQMGEAVPLRPDAPSNPTEASLAAAAASGDPNALKALALLRAQQRVPQGSDDPGPLETIIGPDGKPIRVARKDAVGKIPASGTLKPASGLEKRALNFFNRARQADADLEALEPEIAEMNLGQQTYMQWAPNFAQTETGQLYTQAQRAFTEARLRKDSGAAIPEQEFANDRRTYFAQPGDSSATLAQKRRARGAVLASLGFESGQALGEFVGDADEARSIVDSYKTRSVKPAGNKIGRFEVEVSD